MEKILTIGVSTVNVNYKETLKRLENIAFQLDVKFLVVNQLAEFDSLEIVNNKIKTYHSKGKGLSNSRNLLLKYNKSKWLWIQDDDIELNINATKTLIDKLYYEEDDLFFIKIGSSENKNKFYKNYSYMLRHKRLNALKISSIEILINKRFIESSGVEFNKKIGLGTEFPCCEENLFLWESFKKTNKIKYYPHKLCYHTTRIENRNIDVNKNLIAKGFFLGKLPLYYSIPLMLRWSYKISGKISVFNSVKLLLLGFLKGIK